MKLTRTVLLLVALSVPGVCALSGCGGESSEGPPEGFLGLCRSCQGDEPQGPNESTDACAEFGAEYGCQNTRLTGDCSNEDIADKAVCTVSACAAQPACPEPTN